MQQVLPVAGQGLALQIDPQDGGSHRQRLGTRWPHESGGAEQHGLIVGQMQKQRVSCQLPLDPIRLQRHAPGSGDGFRPFHEADTAGPELGSIPVKDHLAAGDEFPFVVEVL